MSKDEITKQKIYNLQVKFVDKDKTKAFTYLHRIKFYENENCGATIIMPNIWFEHQDLDKYVADLEAKLAEKERALEVKESVNQAYKATLSLKDSDFSDLVRENAQLKKQLSEKEKENENIKLCKCVNCTNEYEFMLEGLIEDLEKQIDRDEQDKISFAVEQLEKVKDYNYTLRFGSSDINEFIDKQIRLLKEGD